ncbi:fructose-bisphosphate aldolase [Patescibacteria group bacterium]|nr:fructose-bisphosphate aldolase [Patescibacteria group bacterium]
MNLPEITRTLLENRKGILSFDQSNEELSASFIREGIASSEETRRAFRELVFTTENFEHYVSGVTLSEEGLTDAHPSFGLFSEYLISKKILVGVEVGNAQSDSEIVSALPARLAQFRSREVSFAEWRMSVSVLSSPASQETKEQLRARIEFAKMCQSETIVPVIETDVLMDGTHSAAQAEDTITETLSLLSDLLESSGLDLKGVVVKTAMAVSGTTQSARADAREVAERTVRAVTVSLPKELGGVVFLSGSQTPEESAKNLNWIARMEPFSWPIAFSYTNALLLPALSRWKGLEENRAEAQSALIERLSLAQIADSGGYSDGMEESQLGKL